MIRQSCVFAMAALGCAAAYGQAQRAPDRWSVFPPQTYVEPAGSMPNAPVLVKSLGDAAEYVLRWKPPANAAEWTARRVEVDRALRRSLGLEPLPARTPLNPRILANHGFDGYSIENLTFESRPGLVITANLYRPANGSGKRPAVLSPIGHFLRYGKAASEVQARCIGLARMGFVVLVYDAIGQGERMVRGNVHHEAGYALLPLGETIAGWMVWDSMRAIDYLQSLDDVDPERIGITGNSGGGLNSLLTAALDRRVKAAVVTGFTFEFNNWLKYGGIHCTCTHWPGIFRSMEWFEVAGLIAPRAVLLMQGDHDNIFPISGARRAAAGTATVYRLMGHAREFRFDELAGQPHAYARPYRERMYGWMNLHLQHIGEGAPMAETGVEPLGEEDGRLRCDPSGRLVAEAPTVVESARIKALEAIGRLPAQCTAASKETVLRWVRDLVAAPTGSPHYLAARAGTGVEVPGGSLHKFSFLSEDGENLPGLLWKPAKPATPARTVLIADARGKAAVAQSGLVQPLLEAGMTVAAVDLRGRGETLLEYRPGFNLNFRLLANQVLMGQPLAGRRAFDVSRTLDCLAKLGAGTGEISVVGIGDDALPVLLAAAADNRIHSVAVSGYVHSLAEHMRAMQLYEPAEMRNQWNSAQVDGLIRTGDMPVDLGSVIPSALLNADVPDIAALISPRRLLFCGARGGGAPEPAQLASRFRRVAESAGADWVDYAPDTPLTPERLRDWLILK